MRKPAGYLRISLFILVGLLVRTDVLSREIVAASLSRADIQAAVNSALPGDVVVLPAGSTSSFSGCVLITTDSIHIRGQGPASTFIRTPSPQNDQPMFKFSGTTGCKFSGVKLEQYNSQSGYETLLLLENSTYFEVFNCAFSKSSLYSVGVVGQPVVGVIHDCVFSHGCRPGLGYGVLVEGTAPGELDNDRGDASWNAPLALGTIDGVYIEDCSFSDYRHYVASNRGARYIVRHCGITANASCAENDVFDTHGYAGEGRGVRKVELYNNVVDFSGPGGNLLLQNRDSGDGVVFNNTCINMDRLENFFYFTLPCCPQEFDCGPYPYQDQPRAVYFWNNIVNGQSYNYAAQAMQCDDESGSPYFVQGRDWFDSPMPGYSPLAYPHPLRSTPAAITASANASPTSGYAPLPVQFSGNGSGGVPPYTYAWSFGDGASSNERNPLHTYSSFGNYTARLTVTDTALSAGTATVSINVMSSSHEVAAPGTITGPSDGTPRVSYTFSAGGAVCSLGHNVEYRFDWGDGMYSEWSGSAASTHSWLHSGTFPVRAQARCTMENGIESPWSAAKTFEVSNGTSVELALSAETSSAFPEPGGITLPEPGLYVQTPGSSFRLKASANENYRFSKWAGDVSPSEAYVDDVTITMDRNKSITAKFFTRCGDVSGDLEITPNDSQMAFDIFLKRMGDPTEAQKENADVNCDGTRIEPLVTPKDAHAIFFRYLNKKELPGDCSCLSRAEVASQLSPGGLRNPSLRLTIESQERVSGSLILVPIHISDPRNIKSFGFDMAFPPGLLEFRGIARTNLTRDFVQVDGHVIAPGTLRVGGYKLEPLEGSYPDALVTLLFKAGPDTPLEGLLFITHTFDDLEGAAVSSDVISAKNDPNLPRSNRRLTAEAEPRSKKTK